MPKFYTGAAKKKRGVYGMKSFSGFLPRGGKVIKFVMKNPTEVVDIPDFTLPTGTTANDFHTCTYTEFGSDTYLQAQVPVGISQTLASLSPELCGYRFTPTFPALGSTVIWDLDNNNHVGLDVTTTGSTNLAQQFHSGLAVGQPCVAIWSFRFNMGLMPSSFWTVMSEYGYFQPLDVTVVVTPKRVKPWAAGPTVRDNGFTDGLEGIGQVPNAIFEEGLLSAAQTYTNPAFTRFETRTWAVPIQQYSFMRFDTNETAGGTRPQAFISENWQRWMILGLTDTHLKPRVDDLLRRAPFCKRTKGGMVLRHKFRLPMLGNIAAQVSGMTDPATNVGLATTIQGPGLGYGKRTPRIPIPGGMGFYPAWFPQTYTEGTRTPWVFPMTVPLGDFVVDTNEWAGNYYARTLPGLIQNFTNTGEQPAFGLPVPPSLLGKPFMMNPPMEWDVFYNVRVKFGGKQMDLQNLRLGQV